MSWWDTKHLTNFATQALKTAQKRIDKVLDIKDEETEENDSAITSTLSSESVSGISTPKPEQGDFFESWLGDDSWPAAGASIATRPTNLSSSDDLSSKPVRSGRKKSDRQKPPRLPGVLHPTRVELEGKRNFERTSDNDEKDVLPGDSNKSYSGFMTSFISAFDQVKHSRQTVLEEMSGKAESSFQSDDGISTLSKVTENAEQPVDTEKESSLVSSQLLDANEESLSVGAEKVITSSQALQETVRDADVADVSDEAASGDVESTVKSESSELIHISESAVPPSSIECDSSVILEDVGWSDVSLSVITEEVTPKVDDILTKDGDDASDDVKSCLVPVTLTEANDGPLDDAVLKHDLPSHRLVDTQMEADEKENIEIPETSSEIIQDEMCPTSDSLSGSRVLSSFSATEHDEVETREVTKSVSTSMLSSLSEIEASLKEGVSMEGSLAASDELSESNKTLTADDLDISKDDTDVDESRQEFGQSEEFGISKDLTLESASDSVSLEASMIEREVDIVEDCDRSKHSDEHRGSDAMELKPDAKEVLGELTISTENAEKLDPNKSDDSPRSNMSGSSYVRNLLEEAMAESGRDSNTDNSHESEVIRESEFQSGHTSADEIDTTTSSDIEIISHISTPCNNFRPLTIDTKSFDVSPSPSKAHGWNRSMRSVSPHSHKRSDSGSSAQSLQSRNGEDLISPEGGLYHRVGGDDHLMEDRNWRASNRRMHSRACAGPDMYKHHVSELCDQDASNNPYDTDKLLKKLAEMATVLEAREKKQLELSQENVELMETNNILKNQLKQLEEAREAELEDVQEVTGEFTRRIAESEKKLQMVMREKDALKKTLQDLELGKRSENVMNEKLLKEKEQVIAELLEEGEKLSKQQLQSNNVIKKLRSKEKDNETTIRSQKQRVDEQKEEIERLEGILEIKVDTEKKHVDTINQLNLALKSQEDEINRLKSELEDAVEKARSLKVALDNSYREISELHKARVSDVTEAHKVAINAEMQVKEQLKQKLEERELQLKQQQTVLITQIEDLQLSLCRMEKEHGRREDILRQEISDLHQRLQEAEERNQELTQGVSAATRPLLRQIENLQTTYSAQSSSYERVEKNLMDRLTESQTQLAMVVEKERLASDRLMESTAKLTSLESQVSTLRQERVQLQSQLDMEHAKVELMQESKNNEAMQRDTAIHKLQLEINDLKKDKVLLENQLEMEKMKVEAEKKKVALVHEQLRDKEIAIMQLSSSMNTSVKHDAMLESLSASSSSAAICSSPAGQQEDLDKISSFVGSSNRASVYDSLRLSSTSSLLENLQSQLKQREGEIVQLQSEINELERTRESMARQLVTLSLANEDMEQKLNELTAIHQKYSELDGRYNALLQMYGEKVEEGEELRMDLADIKEMYKTQIDELLKSKAISSTNWHF